MANPGTTYFGLTGDPLIDGVTNGYKWSLDGSRTVDFSISDGFYGEYWYYPASVSTHMQTALSIYSLYANIKFNYVGYFTTPSVAALNGSEINLSLDGANRFFSSSSTWAIGLFPNSAYNTSYPFYTGAPGDLYLNINSQANYLPSYEPGSQGWFLLMHELGHVLGLKHPHDSGGTGRPTFSSLGISDLDIDVATVMSYNDDGSWNLYSWDPATPMLLDVLGLMYLYGKNTSTNSGNTTFTLKEYNTYLTLWDPSGTDTLDASQASSAWTILLPNTVLSSLINEKIGVAAPTSDLNLVTPYTLEWLIGNIENVVGTSYSDTIIGNDLNNSISGGGGNDTITGGMGNDSIDGGLGTDYVTYSYARAGYTISYSSGTYTISGQEGADTVVGVEYFKFSDQTVGASSLIDITPPTISLSASDTNLTVGETSTITFTLSESSTNFTSSDATVSGGTLSNFSGSGTTYTVKFTPTTNSTTSGVVSVASGTFSDAAGNLNIDGSEANNKITIAVNTIVQTVSTNKAATIKYHWDGISESPAEWSTDYSRGAYSGYFKTSSYIESWEGYGLAYIDQNSPYPTSGTITKWYYARNDGAWVLDVTGGSYTFSNKAYNELIAGMLNVPNNLWLGSDLNDTFIAYGGGPGYDGKTGLDTLLFVSNFDAYGISVSQTSPQDYQLTSAYFDPIKISGVERIVFSDSGIALDTDSANSAGGIYRLYQAAFDRKPDLGGLGYWIKAADNGKSAVTMAEDFTWSKEFLDLFHLSTPKDNYFTGVDVKTLVEGMYTHVLHRAADSGGLNYYAGVIQSHEKTVGRVLAEISDSPENHTAVASAIANGIQYTPYTAQVMTSLHLIDDVDGVVAEPQTMALDAYSTYSDQYQLDLIGQTHDPMLDWMWLG